MPLSTADLEQLLRGHTPDVRAIFTALVSLVR
jgi:hypothetical protein